MNIENLFKRFDKKKFILNNVEKLILILKEAISNVKNNNLILKKEFFLILELKSNNNEIDNNKEIFNLLKNKKLHLKNIKIKINDIKNEYHWESKKLINTNINLIKDKIKVYNSNNLKKNNPKILNNLDNIKSKYKELCDILNNEKDQRKISHANFKKEIENLKALFINQINEENKIQKLNHDKILKILEISLEKLNY